MERALITVVIALAAFISAVGDGTSARSPEAACRSAMAPYYAALLASAHGDADGTLRHLIRLKSRWEQLIRQPRSDACSWLDDKSGGDRVAVSVAARIDSARALLPRDVPGAHAELEAIRMLLRDARARRGLRTFDDALTDYHDAMERLDSLIGLRNEVALTARDFDAIGEQARAARAAWADVHSRHHQLLSAATWSDLSNRTDAALETISESASGQNAIGAHEAAEKVKDQYFDLLRVLSRLG
jgi:hypothetical protein